MNPKHQSDSGTDSNEWAEMNDDIYDELRQLAGAIAMSDPERTEWQHVGVTGDAQEGLHICVENETLSVHPGYSPGFDLAPEEAAGLLRLLAGWLGVNLSEPEASE